MILVESYQPTPMGLAAVRIPKLRSLKVRDMVPVADDRSEAEPQQPINTSFKPWIRLAKRSTAKTRFGAVLMYEPRSQLEEHASSVQTSAQETPTSVGMGRTNSTVGNAETLSLQCRTSGRDSPEMKL